MSEAELIALANLTKNPDCIWCVDAIPTYSIRWCNSAGSQIAPLDTLCLDMRPFPSGRYIVKFYTTECPCDSNFEVDFFWGGVEAGEGNLNVQL